MSYKPKKINKQNKNKNNKQKDPSKFHFGRNAGTYLIFLGTILGLLLIYAVFYITLIGKNSYYQVKKNNAVEAFVTDVPKDAIAGFTTMEHEDFDELDVDFYCTSFDSHDAHSATFSLKVVKNDNTKDLYGINTSLGLNTDSNYRIQAYVCLTAQYIGMCEYSSIKSLTETNVNATMEETTTYSASVSMDTDYVFPYKVNTWPFKIKIKAPEAYLLLCYYTYENGKSKLNEYVLHYSYSDYYVAGKTVPAI